jgi:phosphatidylserine/phosphatidylglycerophosphate/cardiolipin synthase-like enzyme
MLGLSSTRNDDELLSSTLLDQDNFYGIFTKDLLHAKHEVIIESPFISTKRINYLMPTFCKLKQRGIHIVINTKPLDEQDIDYSGQVEKCITMLQELGAEVLITGGHHRKLAIIDRQILYEGSLNILSQNESCEIMRRIDSKQLAVQMVDFIGVSKFIL